MYLVLNNKTYVAGLLDNTRTNYGIRLLRFFGTAIFYKMR